MSKKPTLAELEQKIAELTEALQRERADAENLRRRTEEDKANLGTFYKVMIMRELLPALDNLERALTHAPKDLADNDYVKGVQSVAKQFEQCLAQLGVERIKTVGEQFDPRLHEAIHMDPSTSSGREAGLIEIISEEVQVGYKIGEDVIRPAMVKVKMQSPSTKSSEASTEGEVKGDVGLSSPKLGSEGEEKK